MQRERQTCLCLFVAALFFAGCNSPQISRIDSGREVYETWPIEIKQAVLDGKVQEGMTPDMVKMSLGTPSEVVNRGSKAGDDEVWIYRKYENVDVGGTGGGTISGGGLPIGGSSGPRIGGNIGGGSLGGITLGTGGSSVGGGYPQTSAIPQTRSVVTDEREVIFRDGVVIHTTTGP